MSLPFNLNRPPLGDDEINKRKDFDQLVKSFKEQSLKQAQGDESWWKNKKIRYTTVIAGATVVCTITYLSLFQNNNTKTQNKTHETVITPSKPLNKTTSFVKSPSPKLSTAYSKYTLNASKGGKITIPSSTQISIPKNALVNKAGKQLVGEVTIEYKEMHDLGDVILNGIPMQYDSAGKAYCLETAGMFDIRAYQNGEPVFIKPGEELKVELASLKPQDKFNQYFLDTVKRNWVYLKRDNLQKVYPAQQATPKTSSAKTESLKREIEIIIPRKIDSVQKNYARTIAFLPKPSEPLKPEKATGKRPEFVIDADTKDFPELSAYENTLFEVGTENNNYSKELHEITWNDVQLLPGPNKGKNYILQLSYRGQKQKLVVYPVLKGADYKKAEAIYEAKFQDYLSLLETRQAKEKQLLKELQLKQQQYLSDQKRKQEELDKEQLRLKIEMQQNQSRQMLAGFNGTAEQNKVNRIFSIAQFGIYNSDCPHPVPSSNSIRPVFVLQGKGNLIIPERVYLIDYVSQTVMTYDGFTNPLSIPMDDDKNYAFCVFRSGKVFFCDQTQVKTSRLANSREFKVKALPDNLEHPADFKKFLQL
jgi:hypothetical protein